MSGCSVHIEVSSDSRVVVFAGNLLKAPPLNRRGRKVRRGETSQGEIGEYFVYVIQMRGSLQTDVSKGLMQ